MPPKKVVTEDVNLKASRWGRVKSNLKMGVVGLPNVGKSSLFNLLTEQSAAAENFPFCTIEPNEARCPVPDQRFKWLCDLCATPETRPFELVVAKSAGPFRFKPPSRVPAQLQVTDIAGLIRGAAEGAGLGNAFLSHIQAVDGLYHVVRAFESEEVIHVDDSVDPLRDLETIQIELSKKDLEYFTKQVQAFEEVKKGVKPKKLTEAYMSARDKIKALLEACKPALMAEFTDGEIMDIKHVVPALITTKPVVYLVNLSKKSFVTKKSKWLPKIAAWIAANGGGQAIPFSVEYEEELFRLRADKAAVEQLIKDNDGAKSVLPRIVKVGFKELNLIYFFTAGDKEVRAWNIYNGSLAPQAAGAIHSDFERGFIKAEIAAFDDFKEHHGDKATMANLKALGKYRMEGKQYLVKDGDIIEFKFNVSK